MVTNFYVPPEMSHNATFKVKMGELSNMNISTGDFRFQVELLVQVVSVVVVVARRRRRRGVVRLLGAVAQDLEQLVVVQAVEDELLFSDLSTHG